LVIKLAKTATVLLDLDAKAFLAITFGRAMPSDLKLTPLEIQFIETSPANFVA
jgi:hypothetical protein